jgi:hypothetical protein
LITKEHYLEIARKYGEFASWAVWAEQGEKPKSNIGDISIFDLEVKPEILTQLNPDIVMVGLNCSRITETKAFVNFHDSRPQGQDYKIRYAFKDTKFWGAYMTDIIKDFEEKISGNVMSFLKLNKEFELANITMFEEELKDLRTVNPLIIAFGNHTFDILERHFRNKLRIVKIPHYSNHIGMENYRSEVEKIMAGY